MELLGIQAESRRCKKGKICLSKSARMKVLWPYEELMGEKRLARAFTNKKKLA